MKNGKNSVNEFFPFIFIHIIFVTIQSHIRKITSTRLSFCSEWLL